jgi:spore maturation protein CgeB
MRMLLVGAGTLNSTRDVENGYAAAFRDLGVDVKLYALEARHTLAHKWLFSQWRARGKPLEEMPTSGDVLYRSGIEALEMALRFEVDWVVAVSAMYLHGDVLVMMRRAGLKTAVLFTESPYEDLWQLRLAREVDWCWTNERTSARTLRGGYLAHAYDPAKHYPTAPLPDVPSHDVVFVGTGFIERIHLLEEVDWSGIDLGLYGEWKLLGPNHHLRQYLRGPAVTNESATDLYRNAKIGLNLFRSSAGFGRKTRHFSRAESANPRTFELAACGLFQISQYRAEVEEIFDTSVPTFRDAEELEVSVHLALVDDQRRQLCAERAREAVAPHTYAARAAQALADLERIDKATNPADESAQTKGA